MKEVNDAVEADAENKKKTKGGKSAAANNLTVESGVDVPVSSVAVGAENLILLELAKLNGTVKELSGLKDNFKQLECRVNSLSNNPPGSGPPGPPGSGSGPGSGQNNSNSVVNRYIKCKACEDAHVYCTHCSLCGESGHKRRTCPKNV